MIWNKQNLIILLSESVFHSKEKKRAYSEASLAQLGLLDINNLTEYQSQTYSATMINWDKARTFLNLSKQRQTRSQCNQKKCQIFPFFAKWVNATSLPKQTTASLHLPPITKPKLKFYYRRFQTHFYWEAPWLPMVCVLPWYK